MNGYREKRNANPVISKPEITCFMNNLDFWGEKKPKKTRKQTKTEEKQFSIVELQVICSNASKTSASIPHSNLVEQAFFPAKSLSYTLARKTLRSQNICISSV